MRQESTATAALTGAARFDSGTYIYTDSPGGSADPGAESAVYDCGVGCVYIAVGCSPVIPGVPVNAWSRVTDQRAVVQCNSSTLA